MLMILTTLGLTACGDPEPESSAMDPGQESWLRYCGSCHGIDGEGKPPAFPPVDGSEWLELPPEGLALIVLRGLRGEIEVKGERYSGFMPPMRHMSDRDIALAVGWMETAWAGRDAGLDADDVARIREQVRGRQQPMEGYEGLIEAMDELESAP